MDAMAKSKLLRSLKQQAEEVARHMQDDSSKREVIEEGIKEYEHYATYKDPPGEGVTQADKRRLRHRMRKVALSDEIENLTDVEGNMDERVERRRAT